MFDKHMIDSLVSAIEKKCQCGKLCGHEDNYCFHCGTSLIRSSSYLKLSTSKIHVDNFRDIDNIKNLMQFIIDYKISNLTITIPEMEYFDKVYALQQHLKPECEVNYIYNNTVIHRYAKPVIPTTQCFLASEWNGSHTITKTY